MTAKAPSAIILGAGLMGRLLAHELVRCGHRVQLHEASGPDGHRSAAHAAAAMLAPLAESAIAEPPVVRMGLHGLARWPALLAPLEQFAAPVFFQRAGTLVLWHRQDAAEASRFLQQMQGTARRLTDFPTLPVAQALDAAGIGELEPQLRSRFTKALFLPGEGQLDNRRLLGALLAGLQHHGVDMHWNSPRAPADFLASAADPPWVFDCRGLGAQPQWPQLRGVRGEVIRLHAPEVDFTRPIRLLHPRYPLYIAPKPGHVFVVGATEIESEDLSPVSARSTLELLSAAYSVHSGFAEARVLELTAQCRPALPDNLPALRWLAPRVLQINGLYRHGFLVAPALVDAVMELVAHGHSETAERVNLRIDHAAREPCTS